MSSDQLAGRRLIVLLFDVSSMQPEDVQRAVDGATKYVDEKMAPADLVSVASISSMLNVLTDFTTDRAAVAAALATLTYEGGHRDGAARRQHCGHRRGRVGRRRGRQRRRDGNGDVQQRHPPPRAQGRCGHARANRSEEGGAVLQRGAAAQRGRQSGRAARRSTRRCGRTCRSIRGRPRSASHRSRWRCHSCQRPWHKLFSGAGVAKQYRDLSASQDTLTSLASDTGGRAFLDTNDFGEAFARVQRDMSAYYLLGYASTNLAKDGRFRAYPGQGSASRDSTSRRGRATTRIATLRTRTGRTARRSSRNSCCPPSRPLICR